MNSAQDVVHRVAEADSYTQKFHLRFDECAQDGNARAGTLLRYVVETAFGHSTRAGFPLSWYFSHGLFWLVRQVRLVLRQPIPYGSSLEVTTQVVGVRRFWARRENRVRSSGDTLVATATMDWIFTDGAGRPARIPQEMSDAFPVSGSRAPVDQMNIGDPPPGLQPTLYTVPAYQVDPRGHMNNAAYLDLLEDALASLAVDPQERPAEYELEYLHSAGGGDALERFAWRFRLGDAMTARLTDGRMVVRARRRIPSDAVLQSFDFCG